MITNESIMNAELIEFTYNENGELIEKKDKLNNTTTIVIQDKYVIDINSYEEYEFYTINKEIEPNKKYIYKISRPERVDIELYTKALIAFNEFLNKKFNVDPERKILKFKPKNNRD